MERLHAEDGPFTPAMARRPAPHGSGDFTYIYAVVLGILRVVVVMISSRSSQLLLVTFMSIVCGDALGTPKEAQRYPFDPACAWGRVSNGRGLILRCLTREESERLTKIVAPTTINGQSAGGSSQSSGTTVVAQTAAVASTSSATAVTPPPQPTPAVAPVSATATGAQAASGSAATASVASTTTDSYLAEIVSVIADEGELPLAKKKLSAPLDRYAKCVGDFGGLGAATGQVEVRFLVRERGRAEGANVGKFQGMSEAAASCIAQVVDRRPTGVPEAPVVGVTALVRVRKKPR